MSDPRVKAELELADSRDVDWTLEQASDERLSPAARDRIELELELVELEHARRLAVAAWHARRRGRAL